MTSAVALLLINLDVIQLGGVRELAKTNRLALLSKSAKLVRVVS